MNYITKTILALLYCFMMIGCNGSSNYLIGGSIGDQSTPYTYTPTEIKTDLLYLSPEILIGQWCSEDLKYQFNFKNSRQLELAIDGGQSSNNLFWDTEDNLILIKNSRNLLADAFEFKVNSLDEFELSFGNEDLNLNRCTSMNNYPLRTQFNIDENYVPTVDVGLVRKWCSLNSNLIINFKRKGAVIDNLTGVKSKTLNQVKWLAYGGQLFFITPLASPSPLNYTISENNTLSLLENNMSNTMLETYIGDYQICDD